MKIEMGESLFYSWLRHVKECQVVQTNWKTSPKWTLMHEDDLHNLHVTTDKHFRAKYNYNIFKQNSSLSQIIQQAECDAIGIALQDSVNVIYTVDVAFHEAGLNYGTRDVTVMKVIAKLVRTAMCLRGYLGTKNADIIFASPKINSAVYGDLEPCIKDLNDIFLKHGFGFRARIIANEEFNDTVLQPILLVSDGVADTSELFLRSYQMFNMFTNKAVPNMTKQTSIARPVQGNDSSSIEYTNESIYKELKIGRLAQVVFRKILEEGQVTEGEVYYMQQAEYSKQFFDLQYPVLVKANSNYDPVRYYVNPIIIRGEKYMLCSQWFETDANNDRPYLVKWIETHIKTNNSFNKRLESNEKIEEVNDKRLIRVDAYCSHCGNKITTAGMKFCTNCGSLLRSS